MDPTNTIGFISVFTNTFDSGLSDFTAYSRRIWLSNNYGRERNRLGFGDVGNGQATSPVGPPGPSALKASLAISPQRIRETYDRAFILVGPEFSKGDAPSRETLAAALSVLRTTLVPLSKAVKYTASHPRSPPPVIDLNSITFTTTRVLAMVITALACQYERQAISRPIPPTLPGISMPRKPVARRHSGMLESLEERYEKELLQLSGDRDEDICSISPSDAISQVDAKRKAEKQSKPSCGDQHENRNFPVRKTESKVRQANGCEVEGEKLGGWSLGDAVGQPFTSSCKNEEQLKFQGQGDIFERSFHTCIESRAEHGKLQREELGAKTNLADTPKARKPPKRLSCTTHPPSPPPTPPNTQIEEDCERRPRVMKLIVEECEQDAEVQSRRRMEIRWKKTGLERDDKDNAGQQHDAAFSPLSFSDSLPMRPKNSVFSIFCPEALALQVDSTKGVPSDAKCSQCSYSFHASLAWPSAAADMSLLKPLISPRMSAFLETRQNRGRKGSASSSASSEASGTELWLKEGFRITPRFLAKSHCEEGKGFGCVLCTETGWTDRYTSAEELRDHLNEKHTKWQMLHDMDMK